MKMTRLTRKFARSVVFGLAFFSLFSGCVGTEVGNGLKPKPDDEDHRNSSKQEQSDNKNGTAAPTTSPVSDSQDALKTPLEIPLLRELMLQNCGSPLGNAQQSDGILSRNRNTDPVAERLFNVSVAAGIWTLSDPAGTFGGGADFTITPSGALNFKGQTNIRDGAIVADTYTCSGVTLGARAAIENSSRCRVVYSMTLTKISDSNKVYTLVWTATLDKALPPLQAEYMLEHVVVTGAEGGSTVFAIFP